MTYWSKLGDQSHDRRPGAIPGPGREAHSAHGGLLAEHRLRHRRLQQRPRLAPLPISLNAIRVDCLSPLRRHCRRSSRGFCRGGVGERLRRDADAASRRRPAATRRPQFGGITTDQDGLPPQPPDRTAAGSAAGQVPTAARAQAPTITIAGADITALSNNWFVARQGCHLQQQRQLAASLPASPAPPPSAARHAGLGQARGDGANPRRA